MNYKTQEIPDISNLEAIIPVAVGWVRSHPHPLHLLEVRDLPLDLMVLVHVTGEYIYRLEAHGSSFGTSALASSYQEALVWCARTGDPVLLRQTTHEVLGVYPEMNPGPAD